MSAVKDEHQKIVVANEMAKEGSELSKTKSSVTEECEIINIDDDTDEDEEIQFLTEVVQPKKTQVFHPPELSDYAKSQSANKSCQHASSNATIVEVLTNCSLYIFLSNFSLCF